MERERLLDAPAPGGIAPNILAARLRKLERNGLVAATPYSDRPSRLSYELTADGKELGGALASSRLGWLGWWVRTPRGTTRPAGPPSRPARGGPPAKAASSMARQTTSTGSDPLGRCHT